MLHPGATSGTWHLSRAAGSMAPVQLAGHQAPAAFLSRWQAPGSNGCARSEKVMMMPRGAEQEDEAMMMMMMPAEVSGSLLGLY